MTRFAALYFLLLCNSLSYADEIPLKKAPREVIPVTDANLRGHKSLYHEGWFIVSSSEKTFSYAKEHAITRSGDAISRAISDIGKDSSNYSGNLAEAGKAGVETTSKVFSKGTELTKSELAATGALVMAEWEYGNKNLGKAWNRFVRGNMTLAQRTEEDRDALASIPGNWYKNLQSDFRNINELTDTTTQAMSTNIEGRWGDAFAEARSDFQQSYEKSGTRGNSLSGLGDIIVGYFKVVYSGLVKPATRTTVEGSEAVAKGATRVIFLPVAGLFVVTGRTIASTGLTLYYTTSMGVKLVSPTVEGGLLTGLSLLSYSAIPVTAVAGSTVGAVNQVAVTAAAPVAGAGHTVAKGAADTAIYAAQVSYDLVGGTLKVTMNQAQAGIALGYNALTAIPTHLLLGTANTVVFLAYDGPRLVVATAKGDVQWSDSEGNKHSVPVQSLPVGSVVDLNALSQEKGVEVQILSDDPEVVQKVLEKLPEDLRTGEQP